MQYNSIERKVACLLSNFPGLKLRIKKTYQKLNYLMYRKSYNCRIAYSIKEISYDQKESFFGYYDKSPLNRTNEYIIFHSPNVPTRQLPHPEIPLDIVVYDIKNNEFKIVDKSYSYNWQQGSRLMWIDDYITILKAADIFQKFMILKQKLLRLLTFLFTTALKTVLQ